MAKILIVEDDIELLEVYSDALKAEGYEIDTADDAEKALAKMIKGGYDLVLLDIILPKINGFEIMEQLKGLPPPQNPNKCVIFLTNLDRGEEVEKGLKLGNGYLVKSQITPGDLIREVGLYLSSSSHPSPQEPKPPA